MNEYVFSICIPVYNTESYLRRALDSIVGQTFDAEKVETVIVNDGSPHSDECDAIVSNYARQLPIQYIKKEKNEGLFLARKTAVQKASGKYIVFLDSDDSLEPHALTVLVKHLACEPDYVQFRIYSVTGGEKSLYHARLRDETHKTLADVLQNKALHNLFDKCCKAQLLKHIYENMANVYIVYAEDYYQSAIIEYFAQKKIYINIPLYNYFRDIGITSARTFKDKKKIVQIIESFHTIEHNLISFFEKQGKLQYIQYVKECIKELYLNFAYWTNSFCMILFVIKHLPYEHHELRAPLLKSFLVCTIKRLAKNILPHRLVCYLRKWKDVCV